MSEFMEPAAWRYYRDLHDEHGPAGCACPECMEAEEHVYRDAIDPHADLREGDEPYEDCDCAQCDQAYASGEADRLMGEVS